MIEVERKFLVLSKAYRTQATSSQRISQGFLSTDPDRTVRVRLAGTKGYLTIKGRSNPSGTSRFEWETEISDEDAMALLQLCREGRITKTRFIIPVGSHIFEVDEFSGSNEGLVLAEVELRSESEDFERPPWLGKEVTGDSRYYNSQLSEHPYREWGL